MNKLLKVELYRFVHSFEIIKYVIIGCLLIFMMPFLDFMNLEGKEVTPDLVWYELGSLSLYLIILCICVIGTYVGREFSNKTLYYEVMNGYTPLQICCTKMLTSGALVSIIVVIAFVIYLCAFSVPLNLEFCVKVFLFWMIVLHYCGCTTLYALLTRNGIIGGGLGFVRFVLLEVAILSIFIAIPSKFTEVVSPYFVLTQCANLTGGIPGTKHIIAIFISFIIELILLLFLVDRSMKKRDFS